MQPRAYFEKAREAHAAAVERGGSTEYCLDLAGRGISLSFASEVLSDRLMRALTHRTSEADSKLQSLRLLAWDTVSTGVSPPSPPWEPADYLAKGHIRGFNRDGIRTAFDIGANVLSLFDETTATAIYWTPDGATLPDYQIGSPFLNIMHWWAEVQQLAIVHSGAVGTGDAGVLLAGQGGSGKSTTSLACAGTPGLYYVSDDYCLLETAGGDRAHSVYSTGKLDTHSLGLLPHFRPHVANQGVEDGEKAIIFLAECLQEELVASLPIKAILLPKTSGAQTTRYRPASRAEAFRALAPSTIFQLTGAGARSSAELGQLARRIPSFHLDLGRDMGDTVAVVKSILEQLA